MKRNMNVRYLTCVAMFLALSFVAVLLARGIPNVQGFLSYEPKDTVIVIAGFIFGPMTCVILAILSAFLEMVTISSTGVYGFLMNAIATCAFTVPAAWVYAKMRSQKGAVIGLLSGVLTMAVCMVAWNYIITPYYMSNDRVSVAQMRRTVAGMLLPVFLPFNLVKGGLNAGLALLLYKPLTAALRKARLALPSPSEHKGRFHLGFTLFALAVFVTFTLLLLVMLKVI
jgi:riboflavin transporter FmnP